MQVDEIEAARKKYLNSCMAKNERRGTVERSDASEVEARSSGKDEPLVATVQKASVQFGMSSNQRRENIAASCEYETSTSPRGNEPSARGERKSQICVGKVLVPWLA